MYQHHVLVPLIGLGVLLIAAMIIRLMIGNPSAARHRVRVLRWRIRLYLRPGPGYANVVELLARWSRLRAVAIGYRSRPSIPLWARLVMPVTYYAVRLGRAHLGRRVIASMEEQTLVIAAPRAGKSGWLADRIIDHPGAVVSTSTRTDLLENTVPLRSRHGQAHVFNPEGIGGFESTFRWNPVEGCEHPAVALQRASAFTAAAQSRVLNDMAFWVGKATAALASLLHAAALGDRTMMDVYRWAHGVEDDTPVRILSAHRDATENWLGPIQEIRKPGRTADSIRITITRALAWLGDPAVAAATTPGRGEGFDVAEFVSGPNTLYMIGTGREDAPIAPLFRAFAEYVHDGAAFFGSLQPHRRLDPPLLMALDEVTQICPVPLPIWMADSAGKGILITAICHGLAQLEGRWDDAGARAIWDTSGVKVILGGVTDTDTLEGVSRLCGEIDLRTPSRTVDDYGRQARTWTWQPVRVLPPELLRTLPDWRALVIRGNLSPVVVRLRMAWQRPDYRHVRRAATVPTAIPALATGWSRSVPSRHTRPDRYLPLPAADWPPHDTPPTGPEPDGDGHRPRGPRRPWQRPDDPADQQ